MAENIRLITYSEQTVTPMNDAIIYDAGIGKNGIMNGVDVSVSGNIISLTGGYGVICGRLFQVQASEIPITLSSGANLSGRLYIRLDLSNTSEPITIQTEVASTLSTLEREYDANFTNGVYEMELARFTVTSSELTNVNRTVQEVHGGVKFMTDDGVSLDDLTDSGIYYFHIAHSPADAPSSANGWLVVLNSGDMGIAKKQFWVREGSENTQSDLWVRLVYASGAKTSWRRYVTENEMYYMPGDIASYRINCGGYLTSGGTYVGGFIPLPKPVHSSVRSVTVVENTGYKISIRQNGKFFVQNVDPVSLGVVCEGRANGLELKINKSKGWGGINNDVVSIDGYIRVRFNS